LVAQPAVPQAGMSALMKAAYGFLLQKKGLSFGGPYQGTKTLTGT
jgi:hypothetical protein